MNYAIIKNYYMYKDVCSSTVVNDSCYSLFNYGHKGGIQ